MAREPLSPVAEEVPAAAPKNPFEGLTREQLLDALRKVEEGRAGVARPVAPEEAEEHTPTCWESFSKAAYNALCCCLKASADIVDGAIAIGRDAASEALRNKINSSKMTPEQKAALNGLSEAVLKRIADRLDKGIDKAVEESGVEADPRLVAALEAGIQLGILDSFVPELGEAVRDVREAKSGGAIPGAGAISAPKDDAEGLGRGAAGAGGRPKAVVKLTTPELWSKLSAHVLDPAKPDIVSLGATREMLNINASKLDRIVADAIRDSGLQEAHQRALLSTGAVKAFFENAVSARNARVEKLALAAEDAARARAALAPVHEEDGEDAGDGIAASAVGVAVAGDADHASTEAHA